MAKSHGFAVTGPSRDAGPPGVEEVAVCCNVIGRELNAFGISTAPSRDHRRSSDPTLRFGPVVVVRR